MQVAPWNGQLVGFTSRQSLSVVPQYLFGCESWLPPSSSSMVADSSRPCACGRIMYAETQRRSPIEAKRFMPCVMLRFRIVGDHNATNGLVGNHSDTPNEGADFRRGHLYNRLAAATNSLWRDSFSSSALPNNAQCTASRGADERLPGFDASAQLAHCPGLDAGCEHRAAADVIQGPSPIRRPNRNRLRAQNRVATSLQGQEPGTGESDRQRDDWNQGRSEGLNHVEPRQRASLTKRGENRASWTTNVGTS